MLRNLAHKRRNSTLCNYISMLYCILIAGWMTTQQCLPQSVSQSEQTTFSRWPALFLLAAPSSRVNSASWRLTLRQILPANRRLVSVSSTQLPREKELRAQARTLFCGGCTKTRRLQDVFSRPGRRHRASSYARALLLLAAFVSACMNSAIGVRLPH